MKRRNPLAAAALSALTPGLGHLYCGSAGRALSLYGIGLCVSVLFFVALYRRFSGFAFYAGFIPAFYLYCMADSVRRAKSKKKTARPGRFHGIRVYSAAVCVHLAVVLPTMLMFVSPLKLYRVPTGSMSPTLVPGDFFLVDTRSYGNRVPERGDVVVFESPRDGRTCVKRVVGLPGERIRALSGALFVDGRQIRESYPGIAFPFRDFSEYAVFPVAVPTDMVYVLGDDRDGSLDSRHFGPVRLSYLKGKALYTFWRRDLKKTGEPL